jgi:hypothetical protein
MSKHTPGPWGLELNERGGFYITVDPMVDMQLPATIASRGGWGHRAEESHANARLIASAPELLEALQKMADAFLDTSGSHGPQEQEAMEFARAAIARATGSEA